MIYELAIFAAQLASTEHACSPLVYEAALDARDVAIEKAPLCTMDDDYDARMCTAKFHIAMQWGEGRFRVNTIGDGGKSFGPLQMRAFWTFGRFAENGSPLRVEHFLASRRQAILTAHDVLLELKKRCGSTKSAIRAYMSGRCEGTPAAIRETEKRCQWIGGCP